MRRLVFVTQTIDADHPVLGATVAKVRALAKRYDEVAVICDRVGRHDLPANVSLRTFGASTRAARGARYARALAPLFAAREPPEALFAHMAPIYAILAWPFAKVRRVPLVLWYTHWARHRTLRAAAALSDVALSVDRRSFPLDLPKVRGIGHGIDVEALARRAHREQSADRQLRLLGLGRMSPSKGFRTLLEACALIARRGVDFRLDLRGPATTAEERAHQRELAELVEARGLAANVRLDGPVPYPAVPALIGRADAVVNPTRGQTSGGALDKIVYEAAACGVPVIACNPHFDTFLADLPVELRFRSDDFDDLARVLVAFAASTPRQREAAGRELQRRVAADHSVETWADRVIKTIGAARG